MSITDELRKVAAKTECANGRCEKLYRGDLEHIADRIDAEHESACAEAYGNGVMSVPIALDESAWVELPKDADGEPIHQGELVEYRDHSGTWHEETTVAAITNVGCYVWAGAHLVHVWGNDCRHCHAPTVEDVLTEMVAKVIERGELTNGAAQTIAEYAKRLTLAEGEDA